MAGEHLWMVGKRRKDIVDEGGDLQLLARRLTRSGCSLFLETFVGSAAVYHAMRRLEMLDGSVPHPSHRGRCRRRGSFKPSTRGTSLIA